MDVVRSTGDGTASASGAGQGGGILIQANLLIQWRGEWRENQGERQDVCVFRLESTKDLHSRYSITVLRSQQGLFHHGVSNVRIEGSRRQRGEMLGIQSILMWVHKKRCGCLGEGESRTHFRYTSLSSHRFSSKTLQPQLFILSVQRKTQITHVVNFLRVTKNWNC